MAKERKSWETLIQDLKNWIERLEDENGRLKKRLGIEDEEVEQDGDIRIKPFVDRLEVSENKATGEGTKDFY